MIYYCYRCGAYVDEDEIQHLLTKLKIYTKYFPEQKQTYKKEFTIKKGKCDNCKRITEYVDFDPTIKNLVLHGYRNNIVIFPFDFFDYGATYRLLISQIKDDGTVIYDVF